MCAMDDQRTTDKIGRLPRARVRGLLIPLTDRWILKICFWCHHFRKGSDSSTALRPIQATNEEKRSSASSIKPLEPNGSGPIRQRHRFQNIAFVVAWPIWWGGYCWGPRLVNEICAPMIVLIAVGFPAITSLMILSVSGTGPTIQPFEPHTEASLGNHT